jgi:serine/threonine-protein kinase
VLSALDYSHRAGIIHRDIKPGNVMLTPAGDVKVMDFGIARAISDASSTMTQTAAVVGTAQYLSPEQARGEPVDSRSDVYSAGCLVYELLTGRPPFIGDSPVAVAYQHVREQAAPPSDHDTDLPPEVDAIVMKSLAKRVEDRYQSAAAMRGDIERYLAGHPVHVTPPPPPPLEPVTTVVSRPPAPVTPVAPPPQEEYEPEERGTRPGLLVFLGILLVIVLGLAAYLLPKMFASPSDQVNVPRVIGLTQDQARAKLADAGFTVGAPKYGYSSKVAANRVISQDPAPDDLADKGATVTITLSRGSHPTQVPYVIGQSRAQAQAAMVQAHLKPIFTKVQSDQPKGTVTETKPGSGQQVPRGTPVTISIAEGPQKVPDVVGLMQDQAIQKLKDAGFNPQVSPDNSSTEPKGTVTGETPNAGQPLQQGSTVYITVSQYEPTSPPTSEPTGPSSPPTSEPTSPPT